MASEAVPCLWCAAVLRCGVTDDVAVPREQQAGFVQAARDRENKHGALSCTKGFELVRD